MSLPPNCELCRKDCCPYSGETSENMALQIFGNDKSLRTENERLEKIEAAVNNLNLDWIIRKLSEGCHPAYTPATVTQLKRLTDLKELLS